MTTLTKLLESRPAAPARAECADLARSPPCRADDAPCPLPDAALVAHIVEHHHAYARRVLPYIVPLLSKIAGWHGSRNGKLGALREVGIELAETIEEHLEEEERELFPALLAGASRREVARRELEEMCRHHRQVETLLALMRSLADGFEAPQWGGRSYDVLMEELAALEEDVREHIHLEKFVLVPRVSSLCLQPC
jgi:regulator of cell morphogenesis and NO signaling